MSLTFSATQACTLVRAEAVYLAIRGSSDLDDNIMEGWDLVDSLICDHDTAANAACLVIRAHIRFEREFEAYRAIRMGASKSAVQAAWHATKAFHLLLVRELVHFQQVTGL